MFLFSLFLVLVASTSCKAEGFPILSNGSTAEISLRNFNVSDPEGQSIEYTYTLNPKSDVTISITNIPGNAYFVIVQAHTYSQNITLSNDLDPTNSSSVNGRNIGLWKAVTLPSTLFYLKYEDTTFNTSLMIAVQAYGNKAPTPGGCNMERDVEVAPFIDTTYSSSMVQLEFSGASPPQSVSSWLKISEDNNACLNSADNYEVYRVYMTEGDFTEDSYYLALKNMMTLGRIKATAHPVPYKQTAPLFKRLFAAYPGTGSAYVVVVKRLGNWSVYVPTFSYACEVGIQNNTCNAPTTTTTKIVCVLVIILGLFACLASHKFITIQTLLLGFLVGTTAFATLGYVSDLSVQYTFTILGGVAVGLLFVIFWYFCTNPYFSLLLALLSFGYFIAAATIFGFIDMFDLSADSNYWAAYLCITFLVPVILLPLVKKSNILATSVLGSFAVVVAIDYYIGSNIRYIFINSIRRATNSDFKWAVYDLPIQYREIILVSVWILLAIFGCICQSAITKGEPAMPPPTSRHFRFHTFLRVRGPERTSLMRGY